MRRAAPFQTGFTLIEVMISIAIFGLVILSIYSSWSSILRGARTGSNAAEEAQRARIAMQTIEDALTTSKMFVQNAQYYSFIADADNDTDFLKLSFVSRLPGNFPGSAIFGDLAVRRVTFSVEPGTNSPSELILRQVPVMMATNEIGREYAISLARDVSLFQMEFFDAELGEWIPEWMNTNAIPRMVRVAVGLGQSQRTGDPKTLVTKVLAVPSVAVLPEYQMPQLMGVPQGQQVPGRPGNGRNQGRVSDDQTRVPGTR